uniref:Uncharacterized protein n=1 Tax=Lepeophtheirus salmonis TaxID=72036 RepID=A0A0K2U0F4_LEPSM
MNLKKKKKIVGFMDKSNRDLYSKAVLYLTHISCHRLLYMKTKIWFYQ